MKKICALLKATMTDGMNLFKISTKKKNTFTKIIVPIFLAISIMAVMSSYSELFMEQLAPINMHVVVLTLFIIITTVMTVIEGIYKSGSLLFNCKDDNLLLSLPIKKSTVLFIRVLKFYIFELLYNSLFLVPSMIVYAKYTKPEITYYLVSVIAILLFPIIPILISCVIGTLITFTASKFKGKSLVQTAITSVLIIAMMFFSYNSQNLIMNIAENASSINDFVTKIYYPAGIYIQLVTAFSVVKLIEFIVVNVGLFAITVILIGKVYFRINSSTNAVRVRRKNNTKIEESLLNGKNAIKTENSLLNDTSIIKAKDNLLNDTSNIKARNDLLNDKQEIEQNERDTKSKNINRRGNYYKIRTSSPTVSIIKKEFSRFINSSVFLTNAGFGLILYILGCALITIKFDGIAETITNMSGITLNYINNCMPIIMFAFICFTSFMTSITSSMISLEGRSFNILKSLPIKPYTIVRAKVLTALCVMLPCIFIGDLIVFIHFKFDFFSIILLLIASVILPLVAETIGIIVNLKYPRMDAKNDTEVVKQSMSSTISVFAGMGVIGITLFLLFKAIEANIANTIVTLVGVCIFAIIYGVLQLILRKMCDKWFEDISV